MAGNSRNVEADNHYREYVEDQNTRKNPLDDSGDVAARVSRLSRTEGKGSQLGERRDRPRRKTYVMPIDSVPP